MRERTHPTLGWVAKRNDGCKSYLVDNENDEIYTYFTKEQLTALGFIEKKEEYDTDNEWIDMLRRGLDQYSYKEFEEIILSHLPKK